MHCCCLQRLLAVRDGNADRCNCSQCYWAWFLVSQLYAKASLRSRDAAACVLQQQRPPRTFAQFRLVTVCERSGAIGKLRRRVFELAGVGSLIQISSAGWSILDLQTQPNRAHESRARDSSLPVTVTARCRSAGTARPAAEQYSARAPKHQKVIVPPYRAARPHSSRTSPAVTAGPLLATRRHSCAPTTRTQPGCQP